jgi:D-glycero-D-manno-heptose 1,7-bisphosphate phosphatase
MRGIFLDRDGVITKTVYDEKRDIYRPAWNISEVELMPNVIKSLKQLYNFGYSLFIVSNQPDFSKGLVDLETLKEIRKYVFEKLMISNIGIRDDYYCFHHPDFCPCECRKPSPYFLLQASKTYNIDLSRSWMIGDRDTDVVCGKNAGTKTIKISNEKSNLATFTAKDLKEVTEIVEFCDKIKGK